MTDTPWKTDGWHTSPWNFDPEVTKEWKFPENIRIHDVTLRDGEQQAGLAYNYDDKIRIAEGLAEVGVHRIEAGMPVVSPDDAKVVAELAKRDFGPKVYSFARCMVDDVKRAVDAGVNGVIMEVPASPHLIEKGYEVTEKKLGADESWQTWVTDPSGVRIEFHEYTEKSTQITGEDCIVG